ncbi:probable RNA-binding protein 18 [Bacillus rossius redtenbacheri]|uniref:probable RNA-binding protein 18 n=1 Tax=Bacillus rossius redtenbacheri TaxID=93214 RepID=UPI002FDDB200
MSIIEAITKPLPLEPLRDNKIGDRRLWLGNLDSRVTEYQLLKLLQKHGTIEKFDLLFHRTGPLAGQPRGYAFVTFTASGDAVKAKDILDGKLLGQKRVVVRWANCVSKEDMEKPKPEINIPALAGTQTEKKISRVSTIQAIEAKLKTMEHSLSDEFEVNNVPAGIVYRPQPAARPQSARGKYASNKPYSRRPFRGGRR